LARIGPALAVELELKSLLVLATPVALELLVATLAQDGRRSIAKSVIQDPPLLQLALLHFVQHIALALQALVQGAALCLVQRRAAVFVLSLGMLELQALRLVETL